MATELAGAVKVLTAISPLPTTNEDQMRKITRQKESWQITLAAATNTAIAEQVAARAHQKCRLVAVHFDPAAAVTGTATDFFTLLVAKRLASNPATKTNLVTYAADTVTTDNAAAFGSKDLLDAATYATYVPSATSADFDLLEGDVITCEVTKSTATGMTYPISKVMLVFEPRD